MTAREWKPGEVRALIDVLDQTVPMDMGHVSDCGYDEDDPLCCECSTLPSRMLEALAAAGLLARPEAQVKAEALQGALDDIKADEKYMQALHDAWGLVKNRIRRIEAEAGESDE